MISFQVQHGWDLTEPDLINASFIEKLAAKAPDLQKLTRSR